MKRFEVLSFPVIVAVLLLLLGIELFAHVEYPWASKLNYIKDERTKACFASYTNNSGHYGPYFTYVPCELLDKADWQYYERKR